MKAARIEVHPLETLTLTDKEFLTGAKNGKEARIAGELALPPGSARFPAVVLVHGSDGAGARENNWAAELNGIGIATFILDSFAGRGIVETITDQSRLGHLAMIVDVYRALKLLSGHPQIDPLRIVVMGFSKGGFAAMYSSMRRFQQSYGPAEFEFAGYIAFYARCDTRYIDDEDVSDCPIRLFHGTADDYVPIEGCRKYVQRLRQGGKDVTLFEFPGAHHAFDSSLFEPIRFMPDAVVPNRCRREEKAPGIIINLDTGLPFSPTDPCVTRGATLGYDAQRHGEAIGIVKDFLQRQLRI